MRAKTGLVWATGAMLLLGLVLASMPFFASLRPTPQAEQALPHLDLSAIQPGTYAIIANETAPPMGSVHWAWLLLRQHNGQIAVWDVPTQNHAVLMPDYFWWRPSWVRCEHFGPSLSAGTLNEALPITCHDAGLSAQQRQDWRWDIRGRSLSDNVESMLPTQGVVEGRYFVVGKH